MPKVAIVTRTHNRPLFLARNLGTVSAQTLTDYVHIVVNDAGDPDKVKQQIFELSDEQQARVTVITNDVSKGREAAVNPGLAYAREIGASYTVILDDDDTWAPEFLERTVEYLENHREYVAVSVAVDVIHESLENDTLTETSRERIASDKTAVTLNDLLLRNFVTTMSLLYRTDVLETIHGWDEDLPVLADWCFNLKLAALGPIAFIDEPLANWHHRTITDPDLGNSIVVAANEHRSFEMVVRDRFLRSYLTNGDFAKVGTPALVAGYASLIEERVLEAQRSSTEHIEAVKNAAIHERIRIFEEHERSMAAQFKMLSEQIESLAYQLHCTEQHLNSVGAQTAAIHEQINRWIPTGIAKRAIRKVTKRN